MHFEKIHPTDVVCLPFSVSYGGEFAGKSPIDVGDPRRGVVLYHSHEILPFVLARALQHVLKGEYDELEKLITRVDGCRCNLLHPVVGKDFPPQAIAYAIDSDAYIVKVLKNLHPSLSQSSSDPKENPFSFPPFYSNDPNESAETYSSPWV